MSTHFTYEIDERKLRVKLKELEPEGSEEAWQSFENYVGSLSGGSGNSRLKNIQVPVNRNVIVPVAFGILIIFFSILLFNFINIKSPEKSEESSSVKTTEPVINTIVPATTTISETNKQPATVKQQETASKPPENQAINTTTIAKAVSKPAVAITPTLQQANSPATQPAVKPGATLAAKTNSVISTATATNTPTVAGNEISGSQGTKKKSKRRPVEVVETDSSSDNRPSLGGEDREAEVRPN